MAQRQSPQSKIASMMTEGVDMSPDVGNGNGSPMRGNGSPMRDMGGVEQIAVEFETENTCDDGECDEPQGFTAQELKITKRFVELLGGADRAREALDKVDECIDCLDLIDDEEPQQQEGGISDIAAMMPSMPDLPTSSKNGMDLSNLYNPNAFSGAM